MSKVIPFPNQQKSKNKIWAVAFFANGKRHIASIYYTWKQAATDCAWRQKEVRAYQQFLEKNNQVIPQYSIITIHASELPKKWRPIPALGFLSIKNFR